MLPRRIITIIAVLLALIGLTWFAFNHQLVIDQIVVAQFQPAKEVSQIAKQASFTEKGNFLFLAARPELSDRDAFNVHCEKKSEQTVVLGCYIAPRNLYIYNVTDPRLNGVRQVTAAHEMLHVAYDRLGYSEKRRINDLITKALPSVQAADPDLADRIKVYDKTEPGERNNELHSIFGTEAASLPPELEEYYSQYFTDRSVITNFASQYDKVFDGVKNQQDQLVTDLDALAAEIDRLTNEYNAESNQLNSDIGSFNNKATIDGGFSSRSAFDAARNDLIYRQSLLDAKRQTINSKIDQYDQKRAALESLNVKVKELNSKIDSSSVPSL
ncbi:MAG: hypothetical protein AAB395_00075 [Patescibacteria group bacterium]